MQKSIFINAMAEEAKRGWGSGTGRWETEPEERAQNLPPTAEIVQTVLPLERKLFFVIEYGIIFPNIKQ